MANSASLSAGSEETWCLATQTFISKALIKMNRKSTSSQTHAYAAWIPSRSKLVAVDSSRGSCERSRSSLTPASTQRIILGSVLKREILTSGLTIRSSTCGALATISTREASKFNQMKLWNSVWYTSWPWTQRLVSSHRFITRLTWLRWKSSTKQTWFSVMTNLIQRQCIGSSTHNEFYWGSPKSTQVSWRNSSKSQFT